MAPRHREDRDESAAPFTEKSKVTMTAKTQVLIWIFIITATFAAGAAWHSLESDSATHTLGIATLSAHQAVQDVTLQAQHDTLLTLVFTMQNVEKKIDYLTGASRHLPPVQPTASLGSQPQSSP